MGDCVDTFRGWYFKCQNKSQTLAVIPAAHRSGRGSLSSVQLITDSGAWTFDFPYEEYREYPTNFGVRVGENVFDTDGIKICLKSSACTVEGEVSFGQLAPIGYNIMGPFQYVPFMECRHSVVSMRHSVTGKMSVNGDVFDFDNALGYIEGDRGRSFPKEYIWTQCHFEGGSLMLSAADIPMLGLHFTGIIGVILWRGQKYRIATYLGARALKIADQEITIRQGDKLFTARLIEKKPHPLNAPVSGEMSRTIHESAACKANYRFEMGGEPVFDFMTDRASFEYEYNE